ncbi:MAG TPA: hypothetical protein VKT29_13650 [Terriglobales bacterium]|nr:hypothetical protein [Terriglobales bacterium]
MAEKPPETRPPEKESGIEPLDQPSRTREKIEEMDRAEERGENPEHVGIDQDPGERQKENQDSRDDPLAA